MAKSLYLTSPEGLTGKSAIALGLVDLFNGRVKNVGVFRPLVYTESRRHRDSILESLLERTSNPDPYEESVGVTYEQYHADPEGSMARIVDAYRTLERKNDMVVVVGSDYTDVAGPAELAINGRIAANIGAPVILTVSALERRPEEVQHVIELALDNLADEHASVVGIVINRADPDQERTLRSLVRSGERPVWVVPENPVLSAATVREIMTKIDGRLVAGDEELLDREAESFLICGMIAEHVLDHLRDGQLAIAAGDRGELLLTLVAAHATSGYPSLAGIVLNGGYLPAEQVMKLVQSMGQNIPVIATDLNTYQTSRSASRAGGHTRINTQRKRDIALSLFENHVDEEAILTALDVPGSDVVTPLMFQSELMERARSQRRRIVLPEPEDDRVLRAASTVLQRNIADIILIGDETAIRARAAELGVDLGKAAIISPKDPAYVEPFAKEYARLRAKKGVTVDEAREKVTDVSFFGTLMVHLGHADGMVSGAAHTTAHTIVPSFQIIKTKPETSIVSSVFLMLLEDRVLVYGDCAVNPDPTAEQLADIAISSAQTAEQFDIPPRIAMLSYSTGESGSGADVDKVREATRLVKERRPDLDVEGPIQYDAAVDISVASKKLPGSTVAGHANVFIFPDLNTGNNTYKAVQRSAGALAIGPVLQGLNKPVNDLSRGALVDDIVNTIAITAIQAQE